MMTAVQKNPSEKSWSGFATPDRHQPLGQILIQAGMISEGQVSVVLHDQTAYEHIHRLGELLVLRGWVKEATVEFFAERFEPLLSQPKKRLGEYLLEAAILTEDQVQAALVAQASMQCLFGQVLVLNGWAKQKTIDFFLSSFRLDQDTQLDREAELRAYRYEMIREGMLYQK